MMGDVATMAPGIDFTYGLSAMECMAGKFLTKARDSDDPALVKEYYESSDDVEKFLPFSMFHLHSCFVMLGVGLAVSMMTCLLEILVKCTKRKLEKNMVGTEDIDSRDTSRRRKQEPLPEILVKSLERKLEKNMVGPENIDSCDTCCRRKQEPLPEVEIG